MITEDYVSFETAKLLKEKGCKCQVHTWYNQEHKICHLKFGIEDLDCPTLYDACKWLREVHKIGIFPSTYTFTNGDGTEEYHHYGTAIINLATYELMTDDIMPRNSYEQAVETAIKYCLENLI